MLVKRFDFSFKFHNQTVIFSGIGSLLDLRHAVKNLKRMRPEFSKKLTLRPMEVTEHVFCTDCQACPQCKKALHSCEGHPGERPTERDS